MFEEIPSRRITERRSSLVEALLAISSVVGGIWEAKRGRIGIETLLWALIFLGAVISYWRKRHEDPWIPPDD